MNLETIQEKLINRAFEHYKADGDIKQIYTVNGAKRFTEYMEDNCYPSKILELTDVWAVCKDAEYAPPVNDKYALELDIIDMLEADRDYRRDFGKQIADKLVAYFEQA